MLEFEPELESESGEDVDKSLGTHCIGGLCRVALPQRCAWGNGPRNKWLVLHVAHIDEPLNVKHNIDHSLEWHGMLLYPQLGAYVTAHTPMPYQGLQSGEEWDTSWSTMCSNFEKRNERDNPKNDMKKWYIELYHI